MLHKFEFVVWTGNGNPDAQWNRELRIMEMTATGYIDLDAMRGHDKEQNKWSDKMFYWAREQIFEGVVIELLPGGRTLGAGYEPLESGEPDLTPITFNSKNEISGEIRFVREAILLNHKPHQFVAVFENYVNGKKYDIK